MDYLPLFHNLKHAKVVVIGGGKIALRKIKLLYRTGAQIKVIALKILPEIQQLAACEFRDYQCDDLCDAKLVVIATNYHHLNSQIAADARRLNIAVNVVDNPELSTVIFPAIVDRDPILVAISSGGTAPVLARFLRSQIESLLPINLGRLAQLAAKYRKKVSEFLPNTKQRKDFWWQIFTGSVANQVVNGNFDKAEVLFNAKLQNPNQYQGEVYLVGAGPGDVDLLTFKALRLIQQADVVLYDRLVNPQIVDLCRRDAEFIYVGKNRGNSS